MQLYLEQTMFVAFVVFICDSFASVSLCQTPFRGLLSLFLSWPISPCPSMRLFSFLRLLWSILCPMILYITPKQQSKHRAQSQASWASSKNIVRPDTNIYPSPSECPFAYLTVPPLLSHVPQCWLLKLWCMHFLCLWFTLISVVFLDAPPPSFLLYKLWVV